MYPATNDGILTANELNLSPVNFGKNEDDITQMREG